MHLNLQLSDRSSVEYTKSTQINSRNKKKPGRLAGPKSTQINSRNKKSLAGPEAKCVFFVIPKLLGMRPQNVNIHL